MPINFTSLKRNPKVPINNESVSYLSISGLLGDKTVEYFLPLGRETKT